MKDIKTKGKVINNCKKPKVETMDQLDPRKRSAATPTSVPCTSMAWLGKIDNSKLSSDNKKVSSSSHCNVVRVYGKAGNK